MWNNWSINSYLKNSGHDINLFNLKFDGDVDEVRTEISPNTLKRTASCLTTKTEYFPILILKLKTKCPPASGLNMASLVLLAIVPSQQPLVALMWPTQPVRLNNRTDNSYASFKFRAQFVVLCSSKTRRFYVNYMLFSCHRLFLSKQNLFFLFFEDTVN